ncbi:hypothetical protein [uncultured Campylobacter sp.]|uniref:hypothetical protein n=1 Tax=uncultured Campylobacter sp. TaxID=218934 RepID=UPI0025CCD37A|nr:hypothetical protein [uncultured Campylobacter sp.]
MIERKPSAVALAAGLNLSPVSPSNEKGKFATDFYDKFDGEPFKTAAENVKFERETRAKTLASAQIKFDLNTNLNRVKNLTNQAVRAANQTRANLTRSQAPKRASNLASNLTKRH